jgi:CubicO group peptidase (beta-lactamase class C family)
LARSAAFIAMPDLPRVRRLIDHGIAAGTHPGAVVVAMLDGSIAAELALGEAQPGIPLTPESILLWMSSTKPIGATAILQLVERGALELDAPVSLYLPEFAGGGKQAVTVRQLLTHTGGFRWTDLRGADFDWQQIIARICATPLEPGWVPGQKAGYHPFTSWYILGELIRRIGGRPFERYVRDEIFLPLEMNDCWIGMPRTRIDEYGSRIAPCFETDKPGNPIQRYSTPDGLAACIPGGNGHGTANQLARFYEMLRRGGALNGVRILSAESVHQMTSRQRAGMHDVTFRNTIDFGLGLIINSRCYSSEIVPYGYGEFASDATFGHSGNQSSAAFCDPQYGLVAVVVFTGMPGEMRHQARMHKVLTALYEDLQLAG